MATLNSQLLMAAAFQYINKDVLDARLKALGGTEVNPFKLGPDGKAIGFADTLLKSKAFVGELAYYLIWALEKATGDIADIASGSKLGGEKKRALVAMLDDAIQVGPFMELLDGKAIGMVINFAVESLNSQLGHDWIKNIPTPSLAAPTLPVVPEETTEPTQGNENETTIDTTVNADTLSQ